MTISKRLRYEILRRDNHACRYCGATAPNTTIVIDHVIPITLGGTDDPKNLVAACTDCNNGKSSAPADATLVEDIEADAMRWAAAQAKAAEIARAKRSSDDEWLFYVANAGDGIVSRYFIRMGPAYEDTLLRFRDFGLDDVDLVYAAKAAHNRGLIGGIKTWRYFCGICWRLINERQEAARALLEIDEAP